MLNKMTDITKTRSKKEDVCVTYDVLVEQIAERIDYFEYEVKDVIEGLIVVLGKLLAEQDKPVEVKNLGRFKVNRLNPRVMKSNLKKFNQELVVEIPEKYTIGFAPNRGFKAKLDSAVKKKQSVNL